jgi:hypothetical protein
MKAHVVAALVIVGMLASAQPLAAQDASGFASAGTAGDGRNNRYATIGGGVVAQTGLPWVSMGAQGDVFPPSVPRATIFVQGNVFPHGDVRPFLLAGLSWGVLAGPVYGAGLELRPRGTRLGFRGSVENYLHRRYGVSGDTTENQVTVRLGILFRWAS